jgi:nucleotide-binding universal stress UspA family protein
MRVLVWVAEGTWPGCIDGARALVPENSDVTLLHVTAEDVAEAAHGAFAGLLGRGHPHDVDPGSRLTTAAAEAAAELVDSAARRLGRPVRRLERSGRVEREVVHAAADADLLVCARDGDHRRLGPHSLGPATRFVVVHAPCPVLLVWPESAPGVESIPPPPRHPPGHHPPRPGAPPPPPARTD